MTRLTQKGFDYTTNWVKQQIDSWSIAQCLKKLQKYEDAEDKGLIPRLTTGEKIWSIAATDYFNLVQLKKPIEMEITSIKIRKDGIFYEANNDFANTIFKKTNIYATVLFKNSDIGKIVFLDEETAQKNLKQSEINNKKEY